MLVFCSAVARDATAAQSPAAQPTSAQAQIPPEIETALKKYVSAYERRSAQDLLTIWPDLQNQKKEFGKIKQHFDDASVSNEHMSLQPLQTQVLRDDAIVQCKRMETFAKTEMMDGVGDLDRNRMPAQSSGPVRANKDVKKKDKIWIKLHKDNDQWLISMLSDKQITF